MHADIEGLRELEIDMEIQTERIHKYTLRLYALMRTHTRTHTSYTQTYTHIDAHKHTHRHTHTC